MKKQFLTQLAIGIGLTATMLLSTTVEAASNRPSGYTTICKSGDSCSVSQSTYVAFGASGVFVYKTLNGTFDCSVETFGSDPIPSKSAKECSIPSDGSSGIPTSSTSSDTSTTDTDTSTTTSETDTTSDTSTDGESTTATCSTTTTTTNWSAGYSYQSESCVSGTWTAPASTDGEGAPLRLESDHFAVYWKDGTDITESAAQTALDTLEGIWDSYIDTIGFHQPYCDSETKYKVAVDIADDAGLSGGTWDNGDGNTYMGMWIGPLTTADEWGLAHEFAHDLQTMSTAFPDCGGISCWIYESHANFMAHQLHQDNFHCSVMLANEPHLYYGSTRDRYCNWQMLEYLKDRYSLELVNAMWSADGEEGKRDPFQKLMTIQNWDISELNDVFGEWAMHNVAWDYQNPDGTNEGSAFREAYGAINADIGDNTQRRHRLTRLETLDDDWQTDHRFVSPYYWAPQRWGYNIIRLYPESDATNVTVKFRGVMQEAANSGWRWGIVATTDDFSSIRYSELQSSSNGELNFCFTSDEELYLVVLAAPTEYQKIVWEEESDGTPYPDIYRYPYMIQVNGAWPQGFQNGALDACPTGTERHSNGNGCATSDTPDTVYVGPYAQVLGGTVSGEARIEDQAVVVNGTVTGGTIGALSLIGVKNGNAFNVSGDATVRSVFYPMGWFSSTASVSGTANLLGDLEYYSTKTSNSFYGMVDDSWDGVESVTDVTVAPPYDWYD